MPQTNEKLSDDTWATKTTGGPPSKQELVENTGTYLYEGYGELGIATSAASWHIVRTTLSGSSITAVERADGDGSYDNVWDNRASLTYS